MKIDQIIRQNLIKGANNVLNAVKTKSPENKMILYTGLDTLTKVYIWLLLNDRLNSKSDKVKIYKIIAQLLDN